VAIEDKIRSAGAQLSKVELGMLPGWLTTAGIGAWLVIGIAAVISLSGWLFVYSASISIPLLLAMVIGMIAYPLCEKMIARGIPKSAAAGIVLLGLFAIVGVAIWITVSGIISQWPAIQAQIDQGIAELGAQLSAAGWDTAALQESLQSLTSKASSSASTPEATGVLSSVFGALSTGLAGIFAFAFGLFIGTTLLFYVLSDWPTLATWIAGHMGSLPVPVGEGILEDAVKAMRGYFNATTITGLVVSSTIFVAMLLMGIPLAFTVALVTFLTCYIPYFGAIISGAFAFFIALGTTGMTEALILLVIVLLAQNVLQTVINARVMGDSLNLHPLVVLVVTMLGGIFGGLLGAALAAPIAALLINAGKRLRTAFGPDGIPAAPAEEPA